MAWQDCSRVTSVPSKLEKFSILWFVFNKSMFYIQGAVNSCDDLQHLSRASSATVQATGTSGTSNPLQTN